MKRPLVFGALLFGAVITAGSAATQVNDAHDETYLSSMPLNLRDVLPPAPKAGDSRDRTDRAMFRETRTLVGTPRWVLATGDARMDTASVMADFSCAVGVELTPQRAPRLAKLVDTAGRDAAAAIQDLKSYYKRERPFVVDHGAVCQPMPELAGTYDYPSGHTTWGWTWGLILANLVPERADRILARARAYGESRIICGAHNASAVEAGQEAAAAILSVVAASPKYQADLKAARSELKQLASPLPRDHKCAAEERILAIRPYK